MAPADNPDCYDLYIHMYFVACSVLTMISSAVHEVALCLVDSVLLICHALAVTSIHKSPCAAIVMRADEWYLMKAV